MIGDSAVGTVEPTSDPRFTLPRTLFIGIGAQKSGTTWLSVYLANHPEVYMSTKKELHYWNVVRFPHNTNPREILKREAGPSGRADLLRWAAYEVGVRTPSITACHRRRVYSKIYDEGGAPHRRYADAFFMDYRGEAVAGEITPAYANLMPETFAEISALAPDVRFIFLMREPVARMISGVRHVLRAMVGASKLTPAMVEDALRRTFADPNAPRVARSRYDLTIARLESVVPATRVFYAFYEELFDQARIDALCDFLGIERRLADFSKHVNVAGDGARTVAPELRHEAKRLLAPVYDYVQERFGYLPAAWQEVLED